MQELRAYMAEVFTDYNDINEATRMQLEIINQTLAELQVRKKAEEKPRNLSLIHISPQESGKQD